MVRKTVFYSGRVQGVGFRFMAERTAEHYEVGGYVRNLSDGRVELVAEGEPREVEAFLRAVQNRMSQHIRDAQTDELRLNRPQYPRFAIAG